MDSRNSSLLLGLRHLRDRLEEIDVKKVKDSVVSNSTTEILKAFGIFRKIKTDANQRFGAACSVQCLIQREQKRRQALANRTQDSVPLDSDVYSDMSGAILLEILKAVDLAKKMNDAVSLQDVSEVLAQIPWSWRHGKMRSQRWAFKGLVRYAAQMLADIVITK